jgi:hypothetical protein
MPELTPPDPGRPAPRQALVVLGMHRSGTSALAGVLAKLGATPPRTLMPADRENPRGYWESDVIYRIHTRLLVALDSEWDSPAPLPASWWLGPTAERFEDELVDAVGDEFGMAPFFVLKDPRMCRLLPLWTRVFGRIGARPGYVLLTRNPIEVADSLRARDGLTRETSLLLWLRYLLEAELGTQGARRTFLTFATLLEDWPEAVRKIAADLAIVWPRPPETCQAEITEFLAADLRHHRIPDDTALESPTIPGWIRRAYSAAMAAARDSGGSAETATWDELRLQLRDADRLVGPLLVASRASARPLVSELETIRHELRRVETDREAAYARIAAYERERATLGAQVGRWLTHRRAEWAPVTSRRGRLVSRVARQVQEAGRGGVPPVSHARIAAAADRLPAPGVTRSPVSDRVCDAAVLAFALWTVCAHIVVAAGGGLDGLILLYAVALTGAGAAWKLTGRRPTPHPAGLGVPLAPSRPPRWNDALLSIAVVTASLVIMASFARRPDALRFWWSALLLLGVLAAIVLRRDAPDVSPPQSGRGLERLLWLLALACVVLTLVAHRPDADDAFYVNLAVAAAEAPGRPLLGGDTLVGIEGLPLYLPVYRVHSFELWNGALAYLTGIPPIYVFHWVSAGLGALLVPLAYAKLFRVLTPGWWLWSVGVLVVLLVVAGETHRWYGNFAFVRMWQGKAFFLSVVLPMIYAYGLRFAVEPTPRGWILLGASQIAAVGCTSSALWAAPVGALVALTSAFRLSRQSLKVAAIGVLGSVYVLVQAGLVRTRLADVRASWGAPGGEPGAQLLAAFVTTLGDSRLLLLGLGTLLVAGALATPGLARRFAVVCPLALLVGLLNPYVAEWASMNLTGPSYWRSMWALPLPVLMALVFTSPLRVWPSRPLPGRLLCVGVVAAFALLVPRYGALSVTNGVHLGWPALKVPAAPYRWAALINQSVAPGTPVAAPPDINPWIGTFRPHAHPLVVRHYLWHQPGVQPEELHQRWWTQQTLAAPELVEGAPQQFREALDRFHVGAVCLANSPRGDTARAILAEAGFRRTIREDDYELWVRSAISGRPAGLAVRDLADLPR